MDITQEEEFLIEPGALAQFVRVLLPEAEDSVEKLSDPAFLWQLLNELVSIPRPTSDDPHTALVEIFEALDDELEFKFSAQISALQGRLKALSPSDEVPFQEKLKIGEMVVVTSIECDRAADIIGLILSEFEPEAQLSIQLAIEKYASLSPAESSGRSAAAASPPKESKQRRRSSHRSPVPPLSLGLMRLKSKVPTPSPPATSVAVAAPEDEGSPWRLKYTALKEEYRVSENAREDLQLKLEKTKKELAEQKQIVERVLCETAATSSLNQRSATDAVDSLEREVASLKKQNEEILEEREKGEKALRAEITRLREEHDMMAIGAEKTARLEAQAERWKAKAEEAVALKSRNDELEKKIENYMARIVESESQRQAGALKVSEKNRQRLVDLEAENVALKSKSSELQARVAETQQLLEGERHKRTVAELKEQSVIADYEAKLAELHAGAGEAAAAAGTDLQMRERLLRLEKENERLREGHLDADTGARLAELECQLEDANRLKQKFEKEYEAAIAKLSLREVEAGGPTTETVRFMQLQQEKDREIMQAKVETLEVQKKALERQLEQEKQNIGVHEEAVKIKLEGQMDSLISALKEQIQVREREVNFLRLSQREQLVIQRREERLMSAAFHELVYRFFQLRSEKAKLASEYEAFVMKVSTRKADGANEDGEAAAPQPG